MVTAAARRAVQAQDRRTLELSATRLEESGHVDHARMIRGEWHLAEARRTLEQVEGYRQFHILAGLPQNFLGCATLLSTAPGGCQLFLVAPLSDPRLLYSHPTIQEMLQLQTKARGQFELAYKEFSAIDWESPVFPEVAAQAAEALLRLREIGAVVPLEGPYKLLHFAVRQRPNDLDAHRLLALVCMDLNSVQEAVDHLREVARLDPSDGRSYRQLGLLLRNQRQHGPAMEAYQEALHRTLKPHVVAEVVEELAAEQVNNGLANEALATLDRCPQAFQNRPELLTLRAAALWQADAQRNRTEVVRLLNETLRAAPDQVPALRLRARIHITEEDMAPARPLLERALRLSPDDHESRHLLAQIHTSQGEHKEAAEQRRRADHSQRLKRELDDLVRRANAEPLADEPRLRAARVCLELGERQSAQLWLRAALACNPQNREARKLLEDLQVVHISKP